MPEQYKRKPNTHCVSCGTAIYRRPLEKKRGRVFCGLTCYGKSSRKESPCLVCGKPILASLNKKTYSNSFINFETIQNGGKLEFQLGDRPNKEWASKPENVPYSLSNEVN